MMQKLTEAQLAMLRRAEGRGRVVLFGPAWTPFYALENRGLMKRRLGGYPVAAITPEGREVLAKLGDQP